MLLNFSKGHSRTNDIVTGPEKHQMGHSMAALMAAATTTVYKRVSVYSFFHHMLSWRELAVSLCVAYSATLVLPTISEGLTCASARVSVISAQTSLVIMTCWQHAVTLNV